MTLREHFPDMLVLRSAADQDKYDDATEHFARGGSRRDLMTKLMALGMTAGETRWHAEYPGRRMMTVCPG